MSGRAPGVSKASIRRLGDRLRASAVPTGEDLAMLQDLRRDYDAVLASVQATFQVALPEVRLTTRLKTIQTLIEKLRRYPEMSLDRVQDIAGARVVRDMTLDEQDELATRLAALFPTSRILDRRPEAMASYGYRAVHVIANLDGRLVEIQVRTSLQDQWAQIVERLGDMWGRQIRYGAPPSQAQAPVVGEVTRARVIEFVGTISRFIALCEADPLFSCRTATDALERLARLMAAGQSRNLSAG